MSKRPSRKRSGRKSDPAPTAADIASPGQAITWRRRMLATLLCLVSPILLNFSFAPYDLWPFGYVALVPLVIGLAISPTRRWGLFSAWLAGLVFWAAAVYWLSWITLAGYLAGVGYASLYWWVAAMLLWAALRRKQPMWLALPLVWVALEFLRAHAQDLYLGPTFPWFDLAHTQYRRTVLIQIADTTGVYGISALLGMFNGLVADAVLAWIAKRRDSRTAPDSPAPAPTPAPQTLPRPRHRLIVGSAVVAGCLAATIAYGAWQLARDTRTEGPIIGIVQEAYPISLAAGRGATQEEILDKHLAETRRFLAAPKKPDLVIWPETMLPPSVNPEMTHLDVDALKGDYLRSLAAKFGGPAAWDANEYDEPYLRSFLKRELLTGRIGANGKPDLSKRQLAEKVLDMSGRLGCPILAGGSAVYRNDHPLFRKDEWLVRNAALWFDPNDPNAPSYAKRHLVPFSEAVPFKHTWLGLHLFLRQFVPEVMEQLDPGPTNTVFKLRGGDRAWRVVSPICFEGTIEPLCRKMVHADGHKRADIMANLSNDGWFVSPFFGGGRASTEQAEHLSHYCFRAVENRVPVVRAVNTGISASIDSNGRIVAEVTKDGRNTMISGTLLLDGERSAGLEYLPGHGPKILVDGRVGWYSLVGDAFAMAVSIAAAVWAIVMFTVWRPKKKGSAIDTESA